MGSSTHPPIDVRAVLDNAVSDARQAAEAAPGDSHLHAKWQDAEQLRFAVNSLLDAAAAGHAMDANGAPALWLGPAKAQRLQAALGQCCPPDAPT